ncbi:ABC transporter permease [Symbiopectobacterium purcellii]|uniref:ABC transporter permease n=1 Tax=Symbiopectobacterium purcellii TaxID=2871826 RepID=A0ABX9AR82_9ENTR|nr:ABC transporter permease [Symbiopectobacterium purcellii]QZN97553.1 ABC transporter permease [Symbiopectobacterium purcellii]
MAVNLRRFCLLRVLTTLFSLWLVSVLTFYAVATAPGDAVNRALGDRATPSALAYWRHQYGLDKPVMVRYLHWFKGALSGEWGHSLTSQRPVTDVVLPAMKRSATLATCAAVVMLLLGFSGGIISALCHRAWPDRWLSALALAGLSIPEFVIATLLILIFSVWMGVLPAVSLSVDTASVAEQVRNLVLPALTLGLVAGCYLQRMVRITLLQQVQAPWFISARLNGVTTGALLRDYLLPNAAASFIPIVAVTLPYLLGGAIVVERLFGYPGLGSMWVDAFNARDGALLQAIVMLLALNTAVCWLVADSLSTLIARRSTV